MRKILLAIAALIIATVILIGVLARFGFIDIAHIAMDQARRVKAFRPYIVTYEMGLKKSQVLLERERAIEDERRSIEIKAEEVAKAEADIKKQVQEANTRKAQAEEEQQKLMRVSELAEREDKVVKMATSLSPADAANVLSGLADAEVARILFRLPEKQAAKVLAAMDSKRSARIITTLVR